MSNIVNTQSLSKIRECIITSNFKSLFNQLGWDYSYFTKTITIKENQYLFTSVAQKRGFVIFTYHATHLPHQAERKKIAQQISALYQEHILIYYTNDKQIWQFSVKQPNQPIQYKETEYFHHQTPELLLSRLRGIFFTLDEEENIHLVDVTERVKNNFHTNTEKTTKKFYDDFKKQHTAFMGYIEGLDTYLDDKRWYASLMLNRLMFIYFIQKKGFLDNDIHYLRNKLQEVKKRKGKDTFYSFYRYFLLYLFHFGLGAEHKQDKELIARIGTVPYLNGGLFDVHELEKGDKGTIHIPDEAFERLFTFFDQYQWHLDTHIDASGNEINPDVIGYIFEKYINDRAAMGAYYTKEDITEYISKNTILPFLFDKAKTACANAFKPKSSLWQLLRDNPDYYIYEAVKKGCEYEDIPEHIAIGIDTTQPDLLERRKEWNTPTPEKFALPTEIWRETIARRQRYSEIRNKLQRGEVTTIQDFITYNLNIRQFAQDAVAFYEGSDFIEAWYDALESITVLDPTCGSGAFLFAALNILEPLYEGCINRMREFTAHAPVDKFRKFRSILADIDVHPHPTYWIYKKIILNNLYGVDIMQEAVEIAKLRLFLKLAAMAEVDYKKPNCGLEPLPDIDFNIRCGNTLVGFARLDEFEAQASQQLFYTKEKDRIIKKLGHVKQSFQDFTHAQLNGVECHKEKRAYKNDLLVLQTEMNRYLAIQYGIEGNSAEVLESFRVSHKPFHWFVEFYEIIHEKGGFDVIIGNPPYVVYSPLVFPYVLKNIETINCKDLYAFVIERAANILSFFGKIGMIVPISIVSTDGFSSLRKLIFNRLDQVFFSSYSMRPAKLFDGVEKHLSTFIANRGTEKKIYSAKYYRWYAEERDFLFDLLRYIKIIEDDLQNNSLPKVSTLNETNIIRKIKKDKPINSYSIKSSKFIVFHTRKLRYFLQFLDTAPKIYEDGGNLRVTSEIKEIFFKSYEDKIIANSTYLSSLFFWYYITYSDCRNLNKREVSTFPFSLDNLSYIQKEKIVYNGKKLLEDLQNNSYFQDAFYKEYGNLKMQVFQPRLSKPIIDEIDKVLAEHYGFTEEELDFIINYDIKYRMGKELD